MWIAVESVGHLLRAGPPKQRSICFKLRSDSLSISWYLMEQSWNFGFLASQGCGQKLISAGQLPETIAIAALPSWLLE